MNVEQAAAKNIARICDFFLSNILGRYSVDKKTIWMEYDAFIFGWACDLGAICDPINPRRCNANYLITSECS